MQNNAHESKIDIRIIVSGMDIAQIVSKAVNNIQLEQDYNIIVSSIIPTVELSIVKKVVQGADILLIGGYGSDETYNILFNELKTDFNQIGLFDYTNIIVDEEFDSTLAQEEILNSIVKSTLSFSLNLINIHSLETKLMKVTNDYNSLLESHDQLIKENEVLCQENTGLIEDIKEIKDEYNEFKVQYSDIYSKQILEVFELENLWQETFNQVLSDEERIVLATDKFKPDNIIVGQGFIAAQSKKDAVEWLKIIKTALIFIDDNSDDLKNNDDVEKDEVSNEKDDYDISNTFENFWD
ncbi:MULTISPECIES: hypothetical protein [Methanobrevibacter]|uniref:hypothetical protein n=1 Tax=Methanobrevibacter TaxID=2172 RepID=UPI0025FEF1EA|nr:MULTISPECIES: hypothetical protein [Methanobrevibacter]MBS7257451.1 hypothetical protein [Methanobrevibacter sp.]MCI7428907.1 hypothetical protein [Methanobrevibacter sp.]MDY3096813.1 hypothetical protein [Methanobrevibacter sp.]